MKIKKTGTVYEIKLEGPIGESSPLFNYDVRDATEVVFDGEKMTYINSIGVKNWILWTVRVPARCAFVLHRVPLVMLNQASMVRGFLPRQARIESFFAPFVCPHCSAEKTVLLTQGQDYEYATKDKPRRIDLPKVKCPKCDNVMETDFVQAKTFSFLNQTVSV